MVSQINTTFNLQTIKPSVYKDFNAPGYYITTPELEKEVRNKKRHRLGLTIATSALLLGFGVLGLMKGLPKGFTKKLDGLHKFLENKLAKISDEAKNSRMTQFYEYGLKKVENASEYMNSVNNATTFKDILFGKLLGKTKFTARAGKKISEFFEKFSRRTVINGYENAHNRFNRMFEVFGAADNQIIARNPDKVVTINGRTLTAKEWLKEIAGEKLNMSEAFNSYFGKKAVNQRYNNTKNAMEDLEKKVWELSLGDVKNNYKNKELYDTFLPQAILEGDKTELKKTVECCRNIITGTEKGGNLKEIMKIYEELLTPEEFKHLQRVADKAVEKLDKAVILETDKFFDKLRDLKLGSAPTDCLSMLTGIGAVTAGLTKAEDNDERISVTLKYGIPALGTIATSLCLGAALVSGGAALVCSTLSGLTLNKICSKIDEYRENRTNAKITQ